MNVVLDRLSQAKQKTRVWIIPVFEGRLKNTHQTFGVDLSALRAWGFKGELRQSCPWRDAKGNQLLMVGAGRRKSFNQDSARRIVAAALRHTLIQSAAPKTVMFHTADLEAAASSRTELFEALAEAGVLVSYQFHTLKARGSNSARRLVFPGRLILATSTVRQTDRRAVSQALSMARWANWGRELLSKSQSHMTATALSNAARRAAAASKGVRCRVLGPREIKTAKMGLLLAVNQGSTHPPRFIELQYNGGRKGAAPVVLIGKGLTYDTGGYNLKPGESMRGMHMDKGGGVAALAAFFAAVEMKVRVNVVCLVPSTDNRVSGDAMCPGDVFVGASGISVEVDNTDAEGRLILADALSYAKRFKPSHIVDLATLTGAAVVALGDQAVAAFCNDDRMAQQLLDCGRDTDEPIWRMPLWSQYEDKLKSATADVKNVGGRWGGAITAALFLKRFVPEGTRWCHLDMAGRMRAETDQGYHTQGLPYGFGPRLLGRWLRSL